MKVLAIVAAGGDVAINAPERLVLRAGLPLAHTSLNKTVH